MAYVQVIVYDDEPENAFKEHDSLVNLCVQTKYLSVIVEGAQIIINQIHCQVFQRHDELGPPCTLRIAARSAQTC